MKNITLEELTEDSGRLMETLPDLLMDGSGEIFVRSVMVDDSYAGARTLLESAEPSDILKAVHAAREIALRMRSTLQSEPRHSTPKKS